MSASVTYGGQTMTKVVERNHTSLEYPAYAYVAAFVLDEAGSKNPTQYITDINNLGTVAISTWTKHDTLWGSQPAADLRLLLRNGEGDWYVSSIAFDDVMTSNWFLAYCVDVSTLTWKDVNSTAQEDMNQMDPDLGPGVLFDPLSPDVEPNFAQCTGGGLYIDSIGHSPDTANWLRVGNIKWKKGGLAGIKSQVTENFSNFTGPGGSWVSFWHASHHPSHPRSDNEYTAINYNSGFRWGGHCDDLDYIEISWAAVIYDDVCDVAGFADRAVKDGSYAYTIFSNLGNEVANIWVDELKAVTMDVVITHEHPVDMRLIVREEDGDWLLSSVAIDNVTVGTHTVNVADLTWENVLQTAEDEMNELDPGPPYGGPGVLVGPTPDPAVPNFVNISGGGMYIDGVVGPEPLSGDVKLSSITWHGLPSSCGDPGLRELLADYTSDCYVNMDDLKALALDWLAPYDFYDFATLGSEWLDCTEPTDVNCSPF